MSNTNTGGPAFPIKGPVMTSDEQGMTLRQYAAIKLRVPDSGTDWLDDMIVQSLRDEFAAKAMQADMQSMPGMVAAEIARRAYEMAEAMLEAREK